MPRITFLISSGFTGDLSPFSFFVAMAGSLLSGKALDDIQTALILPIDAQFYRTILPSE